MLHLVHYKINEARGMNQLGGEVIVLCILHCFSHQSTRCPHQLSAWRLTGKLHPFYLAPQTNGPLGIHGSVWLNKCFNYSFSLPSVVVEKEATALSTAMFGETILKDSQGCILELCGFCLADNWKVNITLYISLCACVFGCGCGGLCGLSLFTSFNAAKHL